MLERSKKKMCSVHALKITKIIFFESLKNEIFSCVKISHCVLEDIPLLCGCSLEADLVALSLETVKGESKTSDH